jgi:hypothetical protein
MFKEIFSKFKKTNEFEIRFKEEQVKANNWEFKFNKLQRQLEAILEEAKR